MTALWNSKRAYRLKCLLFTQNLTESEVEEELLQLNFDFFFFNFFFPSICRSVIYFCQNTSWQELSDSTWLQNGLDIPPNHASY